MIHTSTQLKALVRNLSNGDSTKAQTIIRAYAMERFLERLSLSEYRDNMILKGGALIASMVGIDSRSTFDIDAAIKNHPLSESGIASIVKEIAAVAIGDGVTFEVMQATSIMDGMEYPGIRVALKAHFDLMRIPLKIDFSAGDVITPREVTYQYNLLFEDREISLLAYNLETVLAEKMETLLSRGTINTRMRDYYDLYVLDSMYSENVDYSLLKRALINTTADRGSNALLTDIALILDEIESSDNIAKHWIRYQDKFDYAAEIGFADVMQAVRKFFGEARVVAAIDEAR